MSSTTKDKLKDIKASNQQLLTGLTSKVEKTVNDFVKDINGKFPSQQQKNMNREYNEYVYNQQEAQHRQVIPNNNFSVPTTIRNEGTIAL